MLKSNRKSLELFNWTRVYFPAAETLTSKIHVVFIQN